VFLQFIYAGLGWQTVILIILLATWIIALIILVANLMQNDDRQMAISMHLVGDKRRVNLLFNTVTFAL
jgi:hypothetical protein